MLEHTNLVNTTLINANKIPGVRLWSNPCGMGYMGTVVKRYKKNGDTFFVLKNPRLVKYGLTPGSSDTIGFKVVNNKPIFTAIEIKTPGDRLRNKQTNFLTMVGNFGGIAGVLRKEEELYKIIKV